MNQPPPLPAKPRRLRALLLIAALISTAIYFRGYVGCMLYPECNPLLSVSEMPPWDVPTNPVEKAGYDFAHALQLPDGVPKPVPFDFRAARIKAIESNSSAFEIHQNIAQQYFDHLCATEAGTSTFETRENVDGVRLLRTPAYVSSHAEDFSRYGTELPVVASRGDDSELDRWGNAPIGLPVQFVQAMDGRYLFLEQPEPNNELLVARFVRMAAAPAPNGYQNGVQSAEKRDGNWQHYMLPFMVALQRSQVSTARYALTWRGIRRERDREFAIGAGELIALDIAQNKILAVNRQFVLSGRDQRREGVWWGNARSCPNAREPEHGARMVMFAEHVFVPSADVNNEFRKSN